MNSTRIPRAIARGNNSNNEKETVNMTYDEKSQSYVIAPVPPPKARVKVVNGGAHRGALLNAPAFRAFNQVSERAEIEVAYVDPVPGRARTMVKEAERLGIQATAHEGKVEDIVASISDDRSVIILNVDRASAIVAALTDPATAGYPILAYLLVRLPSGGLWAFRIVLSPAETQLREDAAKFCARIADVSERNSSNTIVGEGADPAHVLLEPQIREWFKRHTEKNLEKIVAGVEPASAPFEVTMNGVDTLPLFIVVNDTWSEPGALANAVLANPAYPIRKGTQFVVAEVAESALRFHSVRRRTDDRVTIGGVEVIDRASVDAKLRADEERAVAAQLGAAARAEDAERTRELTGALAKAAVSALATATRETVSRRNPVTTTD